MDKFLNSLRKSEMKNILRKLAIMDFKNYQLILDCQLASIKEQTKWYKALKKQNP